jgi:hypothetical protein
MVLLSLLDIHSSAPVVDADGNPTPSLIWMLTWKNWVLPLFAFAVAGLSLIEFVRRLRFSSYVFTPFLIVLHSPNRSWHTWQTASITPSDLSSRLSGNRSRIGHQDEQTLGPYHELVMQAQRAAIVSTPSEASMYHTGRYYPSLQQSPSSQPSPTLPPSSPTVQYSPTLGYPPSFGHPPLPSFYQRPSFNNSETSFQYAPDRV